MGKQPAFVIPFYRYRPGDLELLGQTARSVQGQSDSDWQAVVVVDGSPLPTSDAELRDVTCGDQRFSVVRNSANCGAGLSRNIGVREAARLGAPIVMYLDADDLAPPSRVDATKMAFADSAVDWLYSPFTVIDEDGMTVDRGRLTQSIVEILEWLDRSPPQGAGHEVLKQIGLQTGYITLTSSVSVRTSLALAEPFPAEAVSEDAHAWLRYAAGAKKVAYLASTVARYRIPQAQAAGSSVRSRVGESYYAEKARVDLDGFAAAVDRSIARGTLAPAERLPLLAGFVARLAVTMRRERQDVLARSLSSLATILGHANDQSTHGCHTLDNSSVVGRVRLNPYVTEKREWST